MKSVKSFQREPQTEQTSDQSGDIVQRIENLQAYLLQLQESQSVVAQQMTQVAMQFSQIMQNTSIEENNE